MSGGPPHHPGPGHRHHDHGALKAMLGAWALAACSAEETAAVEEHLNVCADCAEEGLRLRDAVGLLHPEDNLDLDPGLRSRVLKGCLDRRPARTPVPGWAAPYDAETARLDALLRDMAEAEWRAPVRLRWFDDEGARSRETTVSGVLGHLLAADGMLATALRLPDPLDAVPGAGSARVGPAARTEAYWHAAERRPPSAVLDGWRSQGHAIVRTVCFASDTTAQSAVSYGDFALPLRDALLERAFECWVHAGDIADAVDYPHQPPQPHHLHLLIDLAARQLPEALAERRRSGRAAPASRLVEAGQPGRTLLLEIEGSGGGNWRIPLDSPGAAVSPGEEVAHVALDGMEFCQLAAGHVAPGEAAAGKEGDTQAIEEVLFAAATLSRM